jgi:hypothetical protein
LDNPKGKPSAPAGGTDEKVKLIFGGTVSADMIYSQRRPIPAGIPFLLSPGSASGFNQATFDGNAPQTTLFMKAIGPKISEDWETSAFVILSLYDNSVIANRYGLLPINAYLEMRNQDWRLSAGLQHDIFSPLDPSMLFFLSSLFAAGSSGASRLSTQATRYLQLGDSSQLYATFGISEPIMNIINGANLLLVEDNGFPNIEGRLALAFGPLTGKGLTAVRPIEIGVSGVYGQLRQTALGQAQAPAPATPRLRPHTGSIPAGCGLEFHFGPRRGDARVPTGDLP